MDEAALIVAPPAAFARPPTRPVRVAHTRDLEALVGPSEVTLPAAHALVHKAPRVVLATPELAATIEATIVLWLAPAEAIPIDRALRPHVLVSLAPYATPASVRAQRRDGIVPVAGAGRWLPPGRGQPVAMSAAALALPLHLGRVRQLLPTVDLERQPLDPELALAGATTLGVHLGRVMLAAGDKPLAAPPPHTDPDAGGTPRDPLEAALTALVRDHGFRRAPGPAGLLALRREAERILREAVRAKAIVAFALDVRDEDGQPIVEVAVRHPKRVEQVILKITRAPPPRADEEPT